MTLSEYLKENQSLVLTAIIEQLRDKGKWGRRGLFAEIAKETGFSAAYVGCVLTGKKTVTENFLMPMLAYLGICLDAIWKKNPVGRPKGYKLPQEPRPHRHTTNLTDTEHALVIRAAAGAKMSEFLREAALDRAKVLAICAKCGREKHKFHDCVLNPTN